MKAELTEIAVLLKNEADRLKEELSTFIKEYSEEGETFGFEVEGKEESFEIEIALEFTEFFSHGNEMTPAENWHEFTGGLQLLSINSTELNHNENKEEIAEIEKLILELV